jgi:hypothetical protein
MIPKNIGSFKTARKECDKAGKYFSWSRNSPHSNESRGSLPCSHHHGIGSYDEPVEYEKNKVATEKKKENILIILKIFGTMK